MDTHADKTSENKSQAIANNLPANSKTAFAGNNPEAIAQRKLQGTINNSPQVQQLKAYHEMANNSPKATQFRAYQAMADNSASQTAQRKENLTGETLQGKFEPVQEKEADMMRSETSENSNQIQVNQLKVIQKKEGDVAQLVNINVGFDGTATQSMFAGPADDLTTNGLGNCIAIVAYHSGAPSQGAVMRHYDTAQAFVALVPDPISGGNALTFNAGAIGAIAAATAAQLVLNVPAAGNTRFAVAIGAVWSNVEPDTARWKSRFNLITAIVAALGVEPTIAAGTVNFDVATSTLT